MKIIERDAPPVLFFGALPGRGEENALELDSEEARHARALRLEPGSSLRLTDGAGALWLARVADSGLPIVILVRPLRPPRPLPVDVWLPVASRSPSLWAVEKCSEFGVARLSPTECVRSASVVDAARSAGFRRKALRKARAAIKQSGGAFLPCVDGAVPLGERLAGRDETATHILLDSGGEPIDEILARVPEHASVVVFAGPEGGLVDEERRRCLEAGFMPARLGDTVLRFETALVAAIAAVSLWHGRSA